jgi:hypothetical protein
MLRNLATIMLDEYQRARTKLDKSLIISDVADHIRQQGHFVKRNPTTEEWVIAEDLLCREKVSAVFRDALHQRSRNYTYISNQRANRAEEQSNQDFAAMTSSTLGMKGVDRKEEQFNTVLGPLPVIEWIWRPTSPSLLGLERPSIAYGNDQIPLPCWGPQSSDKNDGFSIFAAALANIAEDGDPFEPKPFYEGPASA